jgi:signal transduction histidine kinase
VSAITAIRPRPRAANSLPVDIGVALGLGGLGALYLQSRTGSGELLEGAAAIVGAALLGVYSATVPAGSRTSLRGIALAAVAVSLAVLAAPHPSLSDFVPLSLPFAIFVLTRVQLARQMHAEMVRDQAAALEGEQAERARLAVIEERARIARELHDVVAHSVGVMIVQAQGAERILDTNPGASREALRVIASTGREAMAEMHRMVGVLRHGDDGDSLAPQPGLAQLDGLLDQARSAGLPVTASFEGEVRPLPPGMELVAYRIVQEALTNARKHAGPASAEVHIRYGRGALEILVSDDGQSESAGAQGSRLGLIGMRERVALYGGTLVAERRPEGGFVVSASLPYDSKPN